MKDTKKSERKASLAERTVKAGGEMRSDVWTGPGLPTGESAGHGGVVCLWTAYDNPVVDELGRRERLAA